jgi:pimeloyl-ACP methyl ester carboxylesterase
MTTAGAPVRLQTHVWNPIGRRRALLLHGLVADGTTWWRLASALAEDGWMVVAPDLRSHGASPTAADHRLATLAADVALLGDDWDLVVGHSLGGAIASLLLTRVRVAAAVLVDPVLVLAPENREPLRRSGHDECGPVDLDLLYAAHPDGDPRDVARKALARAVVTPDVVDAVLDDNDPWDLRETVADWRARVHVLVADPAAGGLCDPAIAEALADGTRVTAERLVGVGHAIHRERPEAIAASVTRVTTERV